MRNFLTIILKQITCKLYLASTFQLNLPDIAAERFA